MAQALARMKGLASWRSARAVAGVAVAIGSLIVALARAQEHPAISEKEFLEDVPVVLSVSRLATPLSEAPAPITVIDREMIKASGALDIAEVFRLVPGFAVIYERASFPAVVYGIDDAFARRMQVLVDGRSIYTPSFGGVEWSNLPLELEDIERIEVIRGPNAASYGANSFFGVINIITRHASQTSGVKAATIAAGNFNVGKAVFRYGHSVGKLDYRLSFGYQQDDGFLDAADTKRLKRLSVRADYQASNRDAVQLQFGVSDGLDETGSVRSVSNPARDRFLASNFLQLRWQRQLSPGSELSLQYYRTYSRTEDFFSVAIPIPGLPSFTGSFDQNYRAYRDDIELQHTTTVLTDVRLVWGAEARRDKVDSPRFLNVPPVAKNDLQRVFGNVEWRVRQKALINAGLMWEDNEISGADLSPRLALNYHLSPHHTLRVSGSQAKRTPLLVEQRGDTLFVSSTPPWIDQFILSSGNLRSESITSYEIGYIGEIVPQRLFVDARLHRDKLSDFINQIQRPMPQPPDPDGRAFDFANVDNAVLRGFETQVRLTPRQGTRLIANYAYTEVDSPNIGKNMTRAAPKHNFGLLFATDLPRGFSASLGFYRIVDVLWIDGDRLPDYSKLDLRVARRFKLGGANAEFSLVGQNLLRDYSVYFVENVPDQRGYVSLALEF